MNLSALLTVDLHGANGEQRDKFDIALNNRQWNKRSNASTTYTTMFNESTDPVRAEAEVEDDVNFAAKASKIEHYDAVFLLSPRQVKSI